MMRRIGKKIRYFLTQEHQKRLRKKIANSNITIISQNCIGGVIYSMLGMRFNSPTINMFIEDENFVKLVENLHHYCNMSAEPLIEKYVDPIDNTISYPKIKVDDIELCCMHYKNCDDAIQAWNRRSKRVNYNNVLVIANSWNMHGNQKLIRKICENGIYHTICFTYGTYKYINCIELKGRKWYLDARKVLKPSLTDFMPLSYKRYFEKYISVADLINEMPN